MSSPYGTDEPPGNRGSAPGACGGRASLPERGRPARLGCWASVAYPSTPDACMGPEAWAVYRGHAAGPTTPLSAKFCGAPDRRIAIGC